MGHVAKQTSALQYVCPCSCKHAFAAIAALLTCGPSQWVGGGGGGGYIRQRPPTDTGHILRMYSLWPESLPCWISHDKVHRLHTIPPILGGCPWETTEKRAEEEKNTGRAQREVVGNHCFHGNGRQQWAHYQFSGIDSCSLVIFNLHRWIGRHACGGIDKAATFIALRLMSLSFGDWPNCSSLVNYSPWPHLSDYWSWASVYHLCGGEKACSESGGATSTIYLVFWEEKKRKRVFVVLLEKKVMNL